MHLRTNKGIIKVPEHKILKSMFCKHKNQVSGEHCSESGLARISGRDEYTVCLDCGKVLASSHIDY